ncbi:MAG: hypothetical protein J6I73_07670 [Treponema sp.]|nr:hypothetical protein [Treponema sp.]
MKIAFCTISSHDYLPYALNCIYSVKKYNNSYEYYSLITDDFNESLYEKYSNEINFVSLEKIGYSDKEIINLSFKYNILEFNTVVKPAFYLYVLSLGYDAVIYLDSDMDTYNSLSIIDEKLKDNSIIITPHKISPLESTLVSDNNFLCNGIYNLGFIALRNDRKAIDFLNWWKTKLFDYCYIDYKYGYATDQIWVELATTIFDGFYVIKEPGMNVAYWNLDERKLLKQGDTYTVNNFPLYFFHFSRLSANCSKEFLNKLETINEGFENFYEEHINKVKSSYDFDAFMKIPYKFEFFDNGKIINNDIRKIYGYSKYLQKICPNPFDSGKNTLYYFYEKNKFPTIKY